MDAASGASRGGTHAWMLANLFAAGFLPEIWTPDAGTGCKRRLTAGRYQVARHRARIKNEVHDILHADAPSVARRGTGGDRPAFARIRSARRGPVLDRVIAAIGRSKGGMTTKIVALTDALGNPLVSAFAYRDNHHRLTEPLAIAPQTVTSGVSAKRPRRFGYAQPA